MRTKSGRLNSGNLNRREMIRNIAVIGAGGLVGPAMQSNFTGQSFSEASQFSRTNLTMAEVYSRAREALYPSCFVCPQCNGVACAGEMPGIGGIGSGMAFQNNFLALQRVRLKMRTIVDDPVFTKEPDTSTVIFGRKLSFPAFAAPIGPVVLALGKGIEKDRYFDAIIGGCVDAGAAGSIGDNATLPLDVFKKHCGYIKEVNGQALFGLKPRPAKDMIPLLRYVEEAGTFVIAIDTDSGGRYQISDLSQIIRATRLPVVVKGVMTIEDAKRAIDAGAAGIVVSNHGGRRLDHTPGTAEVLPLIADEIKGKITILVDGCVHYGTDVLKYLALGADAVLIGRHIIRAAFGSGREGVALFMNTMRNELASAMSMTAVSGIKKISGDILA